MFFGAGYTGDTNESYAIQLFIDENDKPYYINRDNNKQYFFTDTAVWTGGGCNFYRDWSWNEGSWLNKTSNTAATGAENEDWYTVKIVADTQSAVYSVYLNGVCRIYSAKRTKLERNRHKYAVYYGKRQQGRYSLCI